MTAPVFGRDIECRHCRRIHDQAKLCGEALRDAGIERVIGAEASDWPARAERWISLLGSGATFTAEDLTRAVGRPERPNSVGARIRAAAVLGWIEPVGFIQARRAERHASRMLKWRRL